MHTEHNIRRGGSAPVAGKRALPDGTIYGSYIKEMYTSKRTRVVVFIAMPYISASQGPVAD